MRSCVIYGTVEPNKDLAIDFEWMHYSFNYVNVYYNDNIGVIYGIKCELNVKNGTSNFDKEHLDEFVNKFMTIYKKIIHPDAEYAYFTGIPYEDICDELGYGLYDFDDEDEDDDDDDEDDDDEEEDDEENDDDEEEEEEKNDENDNTISAKKRVS